MAAWEPMELGVDEPRPRARPRVWFAVGASALVLVLALAHLSRSGLAERCPTLYTRQIARLPSWASCQSLSSIDTFAVRFCRDHVDPRRGYVDIEALWACPEPPAVLASDKSIDAWARGSGPDAFLIQLVSPSQQWATERPEYRGDCRWRYPYRLAAMQTLNVSVLRTSTEWKATREVRSYIGVCR